MHTRWPVTLLLAAVLTGCDQKPRGTLDRYVADRPVVSRADMWDLEAMLLRGDVAGFNRLRTNSAYAGKRLDFRNYAFAGLSLEGADLSDSILAGVDFTGADLDHVSFRGSYLATASFARGYSLEADVTTSIGRPTRLAKTDFTGAIVKATEYVWLSDGTGIWDKREMTPEGIGQTDRSGAMGIEPLALEESSLSVTGRTKFLQLPPASHDVRRASELGTACANPFLEVDQRGLRLWEASGVAWAALTNLPAIRVRGQYGTAISGDIVNSDPALVLVLGSDFAGSGDVYSKGAVVVDGARLTGSVFAEGPVWLRNKASPRAKVVGQWIFAETTTDGAQGQSWLSPMLRVPPVGLSDANPVSTVVLSKLERERWGATAEGQSCKPVAYWLPKLKEPSALIRYMAVKRMLEGLELDKPPSGTKPALEAMLADPDPSVAQAAAGVLARWKY